jgi:hypothetical protein
MTNKSNTCRSPYQNILDTKNRKKSISYPEKKPRKRSEKDADFFKIYKKKRRQKYVEETFSRKQRNSGKKQSSKKYLNYGAVSVP